MRVNSGQAPAYDKADFQQRCLTMSGSNEYPTSQAKDFKPAGGR
jgi:hypothetical protein